MKDRIGTAVIALIGILISCFFAVGCSYLSGYITIDSRSKVTKPTFCVYLDRCFRHRQERLDIEKITVSKVRRSSEEKKGWEAHSPAIWEDAREVWHGDAQPVWHGDVQPVWHLAYKSPDNFIKRLFGLSASPVSCLTYGEVPPGYEEEVKAQPLEPGELYRVWIDTYRYPGDAESLRFIIRLDATGSPKRVEYHLGSFFITHRRYSASPQNDLKLY